MSRVSLDGSGRAKHSPRGFTLMEILISMTILLIGLLPMLAVFKTALNNLNRSIEDTYASAIAQSVMDSIRLGLREMKIDQGPQGRGFIFDHDGTTASGDRSDLEVDRQGMLRDADLTQPSFLPRLMPREYFILLPNDTETEPAPPGVGGTPLGRAFLYPRKNAGDNAARKGAEYVVQRVGAVQGRKLKVEKTYQLGKKLASSAFKVEQNDALPQYSFAFTIRTAKAPNPLDPKPDLKQQSVFGGLYEVVVMVYRRFNSDVTSPKNDTVGGPGREFITFVSE